MSRRRMRRRWSDDTPRNVSGHEYNQYLFWALSAAVTGFFALGMLIMVLTNATARPAQELARIDAMTVADAAQGNLADGIEIAKFEGFLVADDAPTMPDDPTRQVIRGSLTLTARSGSEADEDTVTETLLEWEAIAGSVYLSDGDTRIPLAFDLALLPLPLEESGIRPEVESTGSARISEPVAVEYGGTTYPLDPELWENEDSAFAEVVRRVLPHGASVVVVAGVEATADGPLLVDPLGDRLSVLEGTEEGIRLRGQQTRRMFGILVIPLGLASVILGGMALRKRREFVVRSNQ